MLEVKNILGETPVYVAAAMGRTGVLERFAQEVDLRNHYFRDVDKMSVLHFAIIGQKFGKTYLIPLFLDIHVCVGSLESKCPRCSFFSLRSRN